jgi:ribonuclease PH
MRPDKRLPDELRPVSFFPGIAPHADGSVLVSFGHTRVICTACIENSVPRWMQVQNVPGGWLTAEYSMLPYSTLDRKQRDISRGKQDGRSTEIQRLIGRSLRAAVDLQALGQRTLWIDCDVLQADGGTRTAAITGASVACAMAFQKLVDKKILARSPLRKFVAAVSAGMVENEARLDLAYLEDRDADVDCNIVMTEDLEFVEMQGSGEEATFTTAQMESMLALARKGITELVAMQRAALQPAASPADPLALDSLARHFANAR